MGFPINTEVHSDTDIFLLAAHFCVFITYNSSLAVVINIRIIIIKNIFVSCQR